MVKMSEAKSKHVIFVACFAFLPAEHVNSVAHHVCRHLVGIEDAGIVDDRRHHHHHKGCVVDGVLVSAHLSNYLFDLLLLAVSCDLLLRFPMQHIRRGRLGISILSLLSVLACVCVWIWIDG